MKGGKPPSAAQPQAIKSLRLQSSSWGQAIPLAYGENRLAGNIIFTGYFLAIAQPSGLPSGGKIGGRQAFVTYVYTVSWIMVLSEGPLDAGTFPADIGGPLVPASGVERFNIGLARPGNQVISVDGSGAQHKQPVAGVDPGAWKAKRVRPVGKAVHGFANPVKLHDWTGTRVYIRPAGTAVTPYAMADAFKNHVNHGVPQPQHTTYVSDHGENYEGYATITEQNEDLGSNASIPNWNWPERSLCQYRDVYGAAADGIGSDGAGNIYDADPACISRDLHANLKHGGGWERPQLRAYLPGWPYTWGAGLAADVVPPESWSAWCRAADILISPIYDAQRKHADILTDLCAITTCAPVWTPTGLKVIPYAQDAITSTRTGVTYTPSTDRLYTGPGACVAVRYHLKPGDFLPGKDRDPVQVERKSAVPDHGTVGRYNDLRIEYVDRLNAYATTIAQVKDEASIGQVGLLSKDPDTYHEICDGALATGVATRNLARLVTDRNVYHFSLGWRFHMAECMDVLGIPGSVLGLAIDEILVRVTNIAEDKSGKLDFDAEEYAVIGAGPPPTVVPPAVTAVGDEGPHVICGATSPGTIQDPDSINNTTKNYDLHGLNTDDDLSAGGIAINAFSPGVPGAVPLVAPTGVLITRWRIRFMVSEFVAAGYIPGENAQYSLHRFRFTVNGESRPEFEVFFNDRLGGAIKTVDAILFVPAGARVGIEVRYFYENGTAIPDFTENANMMGTIATWQIVCEAA